MGCRKRKTRKGNSSTAKVSAKPCALIHRSGAWSFTPSWWKRWKISVRMPSFRTISRRLYWSIGLSIALAPVSRYREHGSRRRSHSKRHRNAGQCVHWLRRKIHNSRFIHPRGLLHVTAFRGDGKIRGQLSQLHHRFAAAHRHTVPARDGERAKLSNEFHGFARANPIRSGRRGRATYPLQL